MHDLRASLSADGKELVGYSPVRLQPQPRPTVVTNFPAPAEFKTNEELYFAGLRIDQFHAPAATPDPYWLEALKRDPGDVRVNTALGINCIKAGRYTDAETYLRKAIQRATDRYTTPKDCEPFYYLGLALKAQGKTDDAFNQFSKSTWSGAWRGPGYFEMAEIASLCGDTSAALTYVDDSLKANTEDMRALGLKAALLRHSGQSKEAIAVVAAMRKIDPLDVHAMVERSLTSETEGKSELAATVNGHPATVLEVAADYLNAGLWEDGTAVLAQVLEEAKDQSKISPLVFYYLGYAGQKLSHSEKAITWFNRATKAPTDYVFPFQMEMIPVLEAAMQANPADSRAPYYLGNLLYDWQPERAVALWEKSAALGADFPVVYRNLAMVYAKQDGARDKVLANLEKAAEFGGNAMVFSELDKLYEENGVAPEKRLALLESHQPVINRDEVIAREVNLEIFAGKADVALELLKTRFFLRLGRRRPILAERFLGERQSRPWPSAVRRQAVQGGPRRLPGRQRVARDPARGRRQSRRPQGRGRLLDRKRLRGPGREGEGPAVVAGSRGNLRHAGKRTGPSWRRRRRRPRAKSCRGRRGRSARRPGRKLLSGIGTG